METRFVSRRSLISAAAARAAARTPASQAVLTAADIVERIKSHVGIPWMEKTVDRIVAGEAETPVRGIATTMMATLEVIQRAAAAGRNMVITHESTFFSHEDRVDQLAGDETYRYKLDFIRRQSIVVFHFHDHWHRRKPDGIAVGMARELGWERYADPQDPRLFLFPEVPLARLARDMARRMNVRTLRVVGDPKLPVRRAIASWGYVSQFPGIPLAARPDVDVLLVGETREWELVEYVQDMIAAGKKKGLIVIGHVVSEQAGMKYCAEWLRGFIREVPVDFIPAPEPFWHPDKPRTG
ncbi:MAG TPA: Nif3-like dinuclear metal center hexameric protein [Bryobacteraceae bacterium]|nr:Nif3-like dinuclear metal center hexameric protein [Bryobacteraceae bacterium]